jgi:riboflavin biosynthesis pyrimidine reductase/predicted DsbA family dithiol-disulfide isomerase
MPPKIPVAHDFSCRWCWVGLWQVRRLQREFGAEIEWRPYELYPEGMPFDPPTLPEEAPANRPKTPTRFALLLAADGLKMPKVDRPPDIRTHDAHEAVEYAKTESEEAADRLIEALYRAYWEEGRDLTERGVVLEVAERYVRDPEALRRAVAERRFNAQIVKFDQDAYRVGVYNLPTYFIGDERMAEQPYAVVAAAMERAGHLRASVIYADLAFPEGPADRPYTVVNMVATIDGKTVSGSRDESVLDLGSKLDHRLLRRIEGSCDAILMGAGTLRATERNWNPTAPIRIVVTKSGEVPADSQYLRGGRGIVAGPGAVEVDGAESLTMGGNEVDPRELLRRLRQELGVRRLCVLGGSELNAQLLAEDLVDELFLTVAPKVKLGRETPTYAGGEPLPRERMLRFRLIEHHGAGDEVFLRYRRES